MEKDKRFSLSGLLINLFFVLVSLSMIIPFVMVIMISISDDEMLTLNGFKIIPEKFSSLAYRFIFADPSILLNAYLVTIFVTIAGTLLSLLLTSMTAYGISRRDYRYNRISTFYIFLTMLFSGGLVPSYILMTQYLHVQNTLWAMILPSLLSPFNIMIMRAFLLKIPGEIIESAKMDGASEWRIYFRMILPLSLPSLATVGLFISFGYWNEWFNALLYIDDQKLLPLQFMLVRIMDTIDVLTNNPAVTSTLNIDTSKLPTVSARMAMAILAGGPMLIVFPFFQRYFVSGLTVGSIKG
ncbi:carbohydrate ABC transporter permease [Paenibacillus silvisoli]|uniref:carbohydrate ABC transporter permease n=1 Tax=Paenibacillus silvisoli TaxID=3110539 RepID=UPI002804F14F|nr:carbohydrate ABC transporter permease [Paenibacillus silvisoli]